MKRECDDRCDRFTLCWHSRDCDHRWLQRLTAVVEEAVRAAATPHMVRGVEAKHNAFMGSVERALAALDAALL